MSEQPPDSPPPDLRRGALIGLAVVLLLVVGSLVLAHILRSSARLQECFMSGRTNCAPVEVPASGAR